MNALYESEKLKASRTKLVSFIRPAYQSTDRGEPLTSHLEPHPTLPMSYQLDATFNPIVEAQVRSRAVALNGQRSVLTLITHIFPSEGGE
jgi:hypothetical protein